MDETQYDTNLGWWTEKPDQEPRHPTWQRVSTRPRFWRNCVWVVGLATALVCTLVVAATL